jgi:polyhydroxybutyrate depolymerase
MIRSSRLLASLILVTVLVSPARGQVDSLSFDGRLRTHLVHLPPSYRADADTSYSVIIALHGGLGSAENLQDQSQLSAKSDTARFPFIVVYPNGVASLLGIRTWNAGGCCGFARDRDIDDVGYLEALIDRLKSDFLVDQDRIYLTGMSNGGMMAYRFASEKAGLVAAIAPVAATRTSDEPLVLSAPVPLVHFHSFQDENVPYSGGIGSGFSKHYNPPVDSVLTVWGTENGCSVAATTEFDDPSSYRERRWSACLDGSEIIEYVTYDGGHSWPGGKRGSILGDAPSNAFRANDLMWNFFLKHPRTGTSTGVELPSDSPTRGGRIDIFPNPFRNSTTVTWESGDGGGVITIYDLLGRQVLILSSGPDLTRSREVIWNGRDALGRRVVPGIYLVRASRQSESRLVVRY